jgi:ribosome recycling factor
MYNLDSFKTEAKGVEEWLGKEYSQLHTGRANPALLDGVFVEVYGAMGPLKNSASISIEDPKTLRVIPWDKSLNKVIEKALHEANLGFSIAVDDAGVRVIIPALTTETRTKLVKIAKERMEDARITIRKVREAMLSELKDQDLPEDTFIRAKEEVQKLVDTANATLEALFTRKETDILS